MLLTRDIRNINNIKCVILAIVGYSIASIPTLSVILIREICARSNKSIKRIIIIRIISIARVNTFKITASSCVYICKYYTHKNLVEHSFSPYIVLALVVNDEIRFPNASTSDCDPSSSISIYRSWLYAIYSKSRVLRTYFYIAYKFRNEEEKRKKKIPLFFARRLHAR